MTEAEFLKCDLTDTLKKIRMKRMKELEDSLNNPDDHKEMFVSLKEIIASEFQESLIP